MTETTKQTIVLDQTGKRTDMTHTVERVESKDAVDGGGSKSSALKKGLLALLVIAVLAALVYYFVQVIKDIKGGGHSLEVNFFNIEIWLILVSPSLRFSHFRFGIWYFKFFLRE